MSDHTISEVRAREAAKKAPRREFARGPPARAIDSGAVREFMREPEALFWVFAFRFFLRQGWALRFATVRQKCSKSRGHSGTCTISAARKNFSKFSNWMRMLRKNRYALESGAVRRARASRLSGVSV